MMLPNQLPADELAHVRAKMRVLKQRETELRQCFLDECDDGLFEGMEFDVVVHQQSRRVLNKSRLPAKILCDPQYFETKSASYVKVITRVQPRLPLGLPNTGTSFAEPAFDVVERWN